MRKPVLEEGPKRNGGTVPSTEAVNMVTEDAVVGLSWSRR